MNSRDWSIKYLPTRDMENSSSTGETGIYTDIIEAGINPVHDIVIFRKIVVGVKNNSEKQPVKTENIIIVY